MKTPLYKVVVWGGILTVLALAQYYAAVTVQQPLFLLKLFAVLFFVMTPLIIHEMGHWAMLHRYKVPVKSIHLGLGLSFLKIGKLDLKILPIGAAIEPEPTSYAQIPPLKKIKVALAGPIASALYAMLCYGLAFYSEDALTKSTLTYIAHFNAILFFANILPIPPLDGFHIMIQYYNHKKDPIPHTYHRLFNRIGNGLVYGVGFLAIGSVLFK